MEGELAEKSWRFESIIEVLGTRLKKGYGAINVRHNPQSGEEINGREQAKNIKLRDRMYKNFSNTIQ
jgi:hypothetical protein